MPTTGPTKTGGVPVRSARVVLQGLAGLAAVTLLTGCHVPGFAVPHAADTQGQQAARLWHWTEFAALTVGVIVWGLIAYVVLRYRKRRHGPADELPSQRAYNVPIEVVYTVIPVLIIAALFTFTTMAQRKIDAVIKDPAVTVNVTAFQWGWRFSYPVGNVTTITDGNTPPELVMPVDETMRINLTATDVVHAFYVPAFLFQRAAVPGSPTTFDLTPTELGTFAGHCATFCGIGHAGMLFTVRVVTPDQFAQWLAAGGDGPPSGSG